MAAGSAAIALTVGVGMLALKGADKVEQDQNHDPATTAACTTLASTTDDLASAIDGIRKRRVDDNDVQAYRDAAAEIDEVASDPGLPAELTEQIGYARNAFMRAAEAADEALAAGARIDPQRVADQRYVVNNMLMTCVSRSDWQPDQ